MNYLKLAEGFTGLWPKKVSVVLIEASTGMKIGEYKISGHILPEKFNKPIAIELIGKRWRVMEAQVIREASYLFGMKIRLLVEDASTFNFENRFEVPTCPSNFPQGNELVNNIESGSILKSEYRQLEFFPLDLMEEAQKDILKIEKIIHPDEEVNNLLGFIEVYTRDRVFDSTLQIEYASFIDTIQPIEEYPLILESKQIPNGFTLQTPNYMYYGISDGELIRELSITAFESADDEFTKIVSLYGLILVDWCNARFMMNAPDDAPEEEILKF